MQPGTKIGGKVLDDEGKPVAGDGRAGDSERPAEARASRHSTSLMRDTKTDAKGNGPTRSAARFDRSTSAHGTTTATARGLLSHDEFEPIPPCGMGARYRNSRAAK
jgi:hypothetical protein